jgi:GrpB-like predicted nucleotidyltransferase (UPF0157 family)
MIETVADVDLIGGPEKRQIILLAHDPAWAKEFETELRKVVGALGLLPHRVEPVGSTSVPGLAAKPIIDIQLSVPNVEDEDAYVPQLEPAGYKLRVREHGHRMLRTASLNCHLHVCDAGSDWEHRHLLFRDWLRRSPEDRRSYDLAKRDLARRDWPTMNHYADARSEVISAIMTRAEAWAAEGGWSPYSQ